MIGLLCSTDELRHYLGGLHVSQQLRQSSADALAGVGVVCREEEEEEEAVLLEEGVENEDEEDEDEDAEEEEAVVVVEEGEQEQELVGEDDDSGTMRCSASDDACTGEGEGEGGGWVGGGLLPVETVTGTVPEAQVFVIDDSSEEEEHEEEERQASGHIAALVYPTISDVRMTHDMHVSSSSDQVILLRWCTPPYLMPGADARGPRGP